MSSQNCPRGKRKQASYFLSSFLVAAGVGTSAGGESRLNCGCMGADPAHALMTGRDNASRARTTHLQVCVDVPRNFHVIFGEHEDEPHAWGESGSPLSQLKLGTKLGISGFR
jgi:hypothetical protein